MDRSRGYGDLLSQSGITAGRLKRSAGIAILFYLASCAGAILKENAITLEDSPSENVIRLTNNSAHAIHLYYGKIRYFGDLQMFLVRFKDSNGVILPVAGRADGWFTPKMHYASLKQAPREHIAIPAHGSVDFPRNLEHVASWVRWNGGRAEGPCQVQVKLFAYVAKHSQRQVEASGTWQPGPCPAR